jgi:Aldehyde dehydrogenase family
VSSVATGTDKPTYRHFIAGEWVDAADGATFDDLNPYTGEVVASVAAGAREDARRAVEAAAEAFPGCCARPPAWPTGRSARSCPPTCRARSRWGSAVPSAWSGRSRRGTPP